MTRRQFTLGNRIKRQKKGKDGKAGNMKGGKCKEVILFGRMLNVKRVLMLIITVTNN